MESLAQGGGFVDEEVGDLVASGRWRIKGFVESFEEVEENICLLLS